jgi:hypothetical protein
VLHLWGCVAPGLRRPGNFAHRYAVLI